MQSVNEREKFQRRLLCIILAGLLSLAGCAARDLQRPHLSAPPGSAAAEVVSLIADDLRYPLKSSRGGEVVLHLLIVRGGQIEAVRLHKSSGDPLLDQEVLRAVDALRARGTRLKWWPSDLPPEQTRFIGELPIEFLPR
jgi:TonB family protein